MLTTAQIKTLKQTNISVDPEKTKERVKQIWKHAKNETKNAVAVLAGCSKPSIYRIYDTGSISIKLALAIGSVMNVSPFYLTGEADELGGFNDALLLKILVQHGYKDMIAEISPAEQKPKRKYTRKQMSVAEAAEFPAAEAVEAMEPEAEAQPEPEPVVASVLVDIDLPEEDLQALLHSLLILSNAGVAAAADKLARIKEILVS